MTQQKVPWTPAKPQVRELHGFVHLPGDCLPFPGILTMLCWDLMSSVAGECP